jgi:murein L,D-transpeptidase YcbB/YkuD
MKKLLIISRRLTGLLMLLFYAYPGCSATVDHTQNAAAIQKDSISNQLRQKLASNANTPVLYFPQTVKRFYSLNNFQPVWVKPQGGMGQAWQAMLMLDCVLQFGLSHDDYHPKQLLYPKLHEILDTPGKVSAGEQADFEILLTDAVITLVNHLHYGKLNPYFPQKRIDDGNINGFGTESTLLNALQQKDLMSAIAAVQPKSKIYADLQYHTHLLNGLYQDDCYEIPEADIRKMAINMERIRWENIDDDTYVQVNIPSYTVQYFKADSCYTFKAVVGKSTSPTPTLNSEISYFTTAPDVKVQQKIFRNEILPKAQANITYLENNNYAIYDNSGKYIKETPEILAQIAKNPNRFFVRHASGCDNTLGDLVFHFSNVFQIDMHDTPKKALFDKADRDLSRGCIYIADAERLGSLLLQSDDSWDKINTLHNAMLKYQRNTFVLKIKVPLKITYLTCEVHGGILINYNDVYDLDGSLEMALYNVGQPITMRK